MDKSLESIISTISNKMNVESGLLTIGSIFRDALIEYDENIVSMYGNLTISDVIILVKIDDLYDRNIIDEEKRDSLIDDYMEYLNICNLIAKDKYNLVMKDVEYDVNRHSELKDKQSVLFKRLNEYDLFRPFDFNEAIMNQIRKDTKIKKYVKK